MSNESFKKWSKSKKTIFLDVATKQSLDKLKIHMKQPYHEIIKSIVEYYITHEKLKGNGTR